MRSKKKSDITLKQATQVLASIAPLDLAEEWDNVGLLIAPTRSRRIKRILLTIDCTSAVASEAIRSRAELVVAYHPPIFAPLSELTPADPAQRRLLALIEARIALYSPHTALDAVDGGVNDWLAEGVRGDQAGEIAPIPDGPGRLLTFKQPQTLTRIRGQVTAFLKTPYLRVAQPNGKARPIRKIAICAGAGISAIESTEADLYLTGEMKHHDTLSSIERGITVILSEHTHTERGYLITLRRKLKSMLGPAVDIRIAKSDRDPLKLVR